MRPVAIFRFSPSEGPAFFAEWLDERGIAWQLIAVDAGEPLPTEVGHFAGIGMMGGPMSVNDPLPWIDPLCALLRNAVRMEVPIIGHCLGGQLLAKAMGAAVARAAVPEIGWVEVLTETGEGRAWFGDVDAFTAFEWHYDSFALPAGAQRVLTNGVNSNQAYTLHDRHIGFQCHIEMTAELVRTWCASSGDELPLASSGSTMSEADMKRDLAPRIDALQAVASKVYARWLRGLVGVA